MHYDIKKSGAHIRHLRIEHGFTQEDLAKVLSIDRSFLSVIESGKRGCSVDLLVQLSGFFHVSLDYLVFGVERYNCPEKENVKADIAELIHHLEVFRDSL